MSKLQRLAPDYVSQDGKLGKLAKKYQKMSHYREEGKQFRGMVIAGFWTDPDDPNGHAVIMETLIGPPDLAEPMLATLAELWAEDHAGEGEKVGPATDADVDGEDTR